ncbi:MAG: type II toxin-antitoxin system RelE/ParE family toxin [Dissulfurispiraceae bacterium]
MHIKWLHEAGNDLVEIRRYIAEDRPNAAQQVAERILDTVTYLRDHLFAIILKSAELEGSRACESS